MVVFAWQPVFLLSFDGECRVASAFVLPSSASGNGLNKKNSAEFKEILDTSRI